MALYVEVMGIYKHMPWMPQKPFNDIPLLPLAEELETKAVLKLCIEARAALVELKQATELIPGRPKGQA